MPEVRFATGSFDFPFTERTPGREGEEVSMMRAEPCLTGPKPEDVEAVTRKAFIPIPDFESALMEALKEPPAVIEPAVSVFGRSLVGNLTVASIPYTLVNQHVMGSHSQRIFSAESIRALKNMELTPDERERLAREAHEMRMNDFLNSADGQAILVGDIVRELRLQLESSELSDAFQELLLETIMMMWGTFEAFISDSLRSIFNQYPKFAGVMLQSHEVKKLSSIKHVTIEDLAARGFDMSRSMGDYIVDELRFDSLPVMRAALSAVFPMAVDLHAAFRDPDYWLLWQRRNLIAHKRGIVDESYLSKTSDAIVIGTRLQVTGNYIEQIACMLKDTAALYVAAARVGLPYIQKSE
jgi:hypothetical protein